MSEKINQIKRKNLSLSGDENLDNQKCPKCSKIYDYQTLTTNNGSDGCNYRYRVFERHKHICK